MKYKILLLNIGYLTGLNGSVFDYIFRSYRYIFPSEKRIHQIVKEFKELVSRENPDIVCLVEIRKKQIEMFVGGKYRFFDFEVKYAPYSLFRKIPFFKNQENGFLSKEKVESQKIFLKTGAKRIVYILNLPGQIKLALYHFALFGRTRKKQFKEISGLLKDQKNLILCGDFNIFGGISELNPLTSALDLRLCQKEPTIPAFQPRMPFDLFLASKSIKAESRVIRAQVSDHLPVILEIEI